MECSLGFFVEEDEEEGHNIRLLVLLVDFDVDVDG